MPQPAVRNERLRRFLVWSCTVTTLAVAACEPATSARVVVERDSAGIHILENVVTGDVPAWSLAPQPAATLGERADRIAAEQFDEVRGAVRLSDGRIVVGDWGSREARYFDSAGVHLLTVGGPGAGPGEIRFLYNIDRVHGDTMVIDGWPIGSRYWFDEHGDFVRGESLGPWFPGLLGRTLPDGSLLLDTFESGSYGNTVEKWVGRASDGDFRPAGIIERVSRDGSRIDSIGPIVGERFHKSGEWGVNLAVHAMPWSPVGLVAWSRDHLFVGHTERPEVLVYTMTGVLTRILRWDAQVIRVTSADRDAFIDDLNSQLDPQEQVFYRRWLSEIDWPEQKPAFSAIVADEAGFLWVRPSVNVSDDVAAWRVFGPDGSIVATADVPARFDLLDVDATHVIARWKDSLDVDHVGSWAIVRQ